MTRDSLELHSRGLSDEEDDSESPMTFGEELEESLLPNEEEGGEQRYEERFEFSE